MSGPQRVVITGATSGLGRELALQLGRRGWRVAITGRREAALKETALAVRAAGGDPLSLTGSVVDDAGAKKPYPQSKAAGGGPDSAGRRRAPPHRALPLAALLSHEVLPQAAARLPL